MSAANGTPEQVLNGIRDAMETRGYAHMANGHDIGLLLDRLENLTAIAKRAAALISDLDPFGDHHFSLHDLAQLDPAGGYIEAPSCCRGLAPKSECQCEQEHARGASAQTQAEEKS